MHAVFIACLVGGAVATVLFAVLGFAGGAGHGGHIHAGHAHAAAGHGHIGAHTFGVGHHAQAAPQAGQQRHGWGSASFGWALSWLSPLTIAAAAVWFGGIGLLAEGSRLALLLAVIAAVIGAVMIRALMNAFVRAGTAPLQLTGEGAVGTINATVRPGASGEVVYTLEGLHRSLPARSTDGLVIPRGTAVVITRQEGGFAWVEPLDPLSPASTDAERTVL